MPREYVEVNDAYDQAALAQVIVEIGYTSANGSRVDGAAKGEHAE